MLQPPQLWPGRWHRRAVLWVASSTLSPPAACHLCAEHLLSLSSGGRTLLIQIMVEEWADLGAHPACCLSAQHCRGCTKAGDAGGARQQLRHAAFGAARGPARGCGFRHPDQDADGSVAGQPRRHLLPPGVGDAAQVRCCCRRSVSRGLLGFLSQQGQFELEQLKFSNETASSESCAGQSLTAAHVWQNLHQWLQRDC